MRTYKAFVAILLLLLPCCMQAQEEKKEKIKFNYGIKAGFQAVTYNHTDFNIEGYRFNDNTIQSNKIGYTINPFIRLTKGKFYIQTEAGFGITNHTYDFYEITPAEQTPPPAAYKLTTYCFQLPLLVGYNFINHENYGMSVFAGPRAKFIFTSASEQEFSHFKHEELFEELDKRNLYLEVGLGVRIHSLFLDIACDWGLSQNETLITDKATGSAFTSKRNDSVLSFSVGFIF